MTTESPEIKHGKKAVHDQGSANQKTFDASVLSLSGNGGEKA